MVSAMRSRTRHLSRARSAPLRPRHIGLVAGLGAAGLALAAAPQGWVPVASGAGDRRSGTLSALITSPAVPKDAVTVSPAPGSQTADPATQLSFLGRPASQLGAITVVGSRTGAHAGTWQAYSTGDGASFIPDTPFVAGETVTVRTTLPIAGSTQGTYSFTVADVVPLRFGPHPPPMRTDVAGVQHFASAPTIEPPTVTVDANRGTLGGNDVLLAPKGTTGQAGPMIVRPDGQLVWFDPLPDRQEAFDLNEQTLHGKSVLAWFQGVVVAGHGEGKVVIANSSYQTIAVVHGGNGTLIDLHDLEVTNRGTVFVTAYRTMRWNLSSVGGAADGIVFDGVIQEIDIKTGLVEEEWDSLDHVPVSASDFTAPTSPRVPFDYFHLNGLQWLPNGDILVSSRNTSAAYLVDPADSGDVMWTLGGKHSSFTMGPGSRFFFEHDVRWRGDNVLTIFDNGSSPPKEPQSRALFEQLDMANHTATLLRQDTSTLHHVLAFALGNVEPRAHGKVFVGWGTGPNYSEFDASGQLLYDATLPTGDDTYRAFLRHWDATPTTRPSFAVTGSGSATTVSMSWNGATAVARWIIRTGASQGNLHPVGSGADVGFQTAVRTGPLEAVVEVEALGGRGRVLGSALGAG